MPTDYGSYSVEALEEIRSDIIEMICSETLEGEVRARAEAEVKAITALLGDREARLTDDGRDT